MIRGFFVFATTLSALLISNAPGNAQNSNDDEVDPRVLRPYWTKQARSLARSKYKLTASEIRKYRGLFGADLSHYNFDLNTSGQCSTQEGYERPECSCRPIWDKFSLGGVKFVYLKASDGLKQDLSFRRNWSTIEEYHINQKIYRGAYHFLRPNLDPLLQAETFLAALYNQHSNYSAQLPPVLDIEWANKRIYPGTDDYTSCPVNRRIEDSSGRYFCDMWYKLSPQDIIGFANKWIDRVSSETGLPVIVYTNPTAWWDLYVGREGEYFASNHAFWVSRYTSSGPAYNKSWSRQGGSERWRMPPLPQGASYPISSYDVAHFWQFSETGILDAKGFVCKSVAESKQVDLNWFPQPIDVFRTVFEVNARSAHR